jgi:multidrug efflux pump
MVGGLLLSQALTLYTTPVIYIFFDNLAERFGQKSKPHNSQPMMEEGEETEQAGPA